MKITEAYDKFYKEDKHYNTEWEEQSIAIPCSTFYTVAKAEKNFFF